MMMIPRRNHFDLFDEMFRDPFFEGTESKVMKTDIKEKKLLKKLKKQEDKEIYLKMQNMTLQKKNKQKLKQEL